MKVAIVLGTRPEILKFYSVIKELEKQQIEHKVYFTNQHFSYEMGKRFFEELELKVSDKFKGTFDVPKVTSWLVKKFKETSPDVVLVQGDTNSTLAGALAGLLTNTKVGHIEAGLRSYKMSDPFPEESNRCAVDEISTFLFCPTHNNFENIKHLMKYPDKGGYVVGNTIIDLVKTLVKRNAVKKKQVLITLHRRENWERIDEICKGIVEFVKLKPDYEFIYVKHANKKLVKKILEHFKSAGVTVINPQPYKKFLKLMRDSSLIISDSGGVVEEASYLLTPVAVVRDETERQEACEAHCAKLVGTDSTLYLKINQLLKDYQTYSGKSPFGDGLAAKKIINRLKKEIKK